jgi:microcystin degradation protein MlrC
MGVKIFAGGIATETNTFSPVPTSLDDYAVARRGDDERSSSAGFDLEKIWGEPARARGDEFIFSLMAWAQPSGTTIRSAYETLRDELLADLRSHQPVDIVLLMLHGAMVAQGYEDCEQDIITRVRDIVGPETVIGVELDLHCHLSEEKIARANLVVLYKEYPHVDVNERARDLFELAIATKQGRIRPTMTLFDCRMVGLYPTTAQPMRGFVDALVEAERRPGVLSLSFGHGFQFADLPHVGAKVLAIADGDTATAAAVAREMGQHVYGLRRDIGFDSLSRPPAETLSRAMASRKRPVVVADQSDNAGGGAPADATFALRWLLDHGASDVAVAIFYDPGVVKIARKAGLGAQISVRLGGKTSVCSGDPLDLDVVVTALRDDYVHLFPQLSGEPMAFEIGHVAALRHGSIDIVVSSERCQCYSPDILTDLGIEPRNKQLLLVKSVQHFRGAFAPIAGEILYMAAEGAVPPDPRQIAYRSLDTRRLYPWAEDPLQLDG